MSAYGPSIEERNTAENVTVGPETCMTLAYEPLDYSDAVDALLSTERFRPERN
jgi:hypothetical protein